MAVKVETRSCADCGQSFESRVVTKDGEEIPSDYGRQCPACRLKADQAEGQRKAEAELPRVIADQRLQWEVDSNLPYRFTDKTFANFKRQLQPKAYDTMKAYDNGQSILLMSPGIYGVGKTHLAAAVVNHIIRTGEAADIGQWNSIRRHRCPVLFISANDLVSRIKASFDRNGHGDTETEIYQRLEYVDLLIIDDVGKVRARDPSFLQGVFFRVIDHRYSNEMDLILTTNLDYAELEEHIGGASADRLREMCKGNIVRMTGKSYRIEAAK